MRGIEHNGYGAFALLKRALGISLVYIAVLVLVCFALWVFTALKYDSGSDYYMDYFAWIVPITFMIQLFSLFYTLLFFCFVKRLTILIVLVFIFSMYTFSFLLLASSPEILDGDREFWDRLRLAIAMPYRATQLLVLHWATCVLSMSMLVPSVLIARKFRLLGLKELER